jgi:Icc protein
MSDAGQRIIHITDCHLYADQQQSKYGVNPNSSLALLLEQINFSDIAWVILGGDLTNEHDAECVTESYQQLVTLLREKVALSKVCWLCGNHDNPAIMADVFNKHGLNNAKNLTLSRWQIQLVQQRYQGTRGEITAHEYQRLEKQTDASLHQLWVNHHPPGLTNSWMDKHAMLSHQDFLAWLQHQTPRILLHGHIHHQQEYLLGDVNVLSTPSTCWQWQLSEQFAVNETGRAGCREITLYDNGSFATRIISL